MDSVGAELRVHFGDVLFLPAVHSGGDDVEQSQHPHPRVVDHFLLLAKERLGPGAARIHNGGHPGVEYRVSQNAQRRNVRVGAGLEPVERGSAVTDVDVDVHQAGGDVKPSGIHALACVGWRYSLLDCRDLAGLNGYIADFIDAVGRIDHVAARQHEVVAWRLRQQLSGERDHERRAACHSVHRFSFRNLAADPVTARTVAEPASGVWLSVLTGDSRLCGSAAAVA